MAQSVLRQIERNLTASAGLQSRPTDKASIRGIHQGQRSCEIPHRKAGHMTASDHCSSRKKLLQVGGHPHMRRPTLSFPPSEPARFVLGSLVLCQRLVGQFALRTFKCVQIGTSKAGLDTDQHHASLALGAARPLDHPRGMRFRHVMHALRSGGSATLSVTDNGLGRGGD